MMIVFKKPISFTAVKIYYSCRFSRRNDKLTVSVYVSSWQKKRIVKSFRAITTPAENAPSQILGIRLLPRVKCSNFPLKMLKISQKSSLPSMMIRLAEFLKLSSISEIFIDLHCNISMQLIIKSSPSSNF